MREEIDCLIDGMESMEQKDQFFIGTIGEYEVVLVKSGIGKVDAALMTQRLISEFHVELIINTGIGGAMQNGLDVLDFAVSNDALYHDFDATGFGYKVTEIPQMEVPCIPGNPVRKEKIIEWFEDYKNFAFFSGHKIIEGRVAIAHVCRCNKILFVIIRYMSDCTDDNGSKYEFNEKITAEMSATLVKEVLELGKSE